jgi:hypothetical protein
MISLKVDDIKGFMSNLLIHKVFDTFYLSEMTIHTATELYVSGKLNQDFYTSEELEVLNGRKYSTWAENKGFAYSFIKGNKLPLSIKIVFLLSDVNAEGVLSKSGVSLTTSDVNGMFLNLRYEKGNLYLTTGTSIKVFTMDKTLEKAWDDEVKLYLKNNNIAWEEV